MHFRTVRRLCMRDRHGQQQRRYDGIPYACSQGRARTPYQQEVSQFMGNLQL